MHWQEGTRMGNGQLSQYLLLKQDCFAQKGRLMLHMCSVFRMFHVPLCPHWPHPETGWVKQSFVCKCLLLLSRAVSSGSSVYGGCLLAWILWMYWPGHARVWGIWPRKWAEHPQAPCVLEDLKCWGAWEINWPAGAEPRTSLHWLLGGESCRKRKRCSLERMGNRHHQSDQQCLCLKACWENVSGMGWVHMGVFCFSEMVGVHMGVYCFSEMGWNTYGYVLFLRDGLEFIWMCVPTTLS